MGRICIIISDSATALGWAGLVGVPQEEEIQDVSRLEMEKGR